jgi:hypothetical protein
MKFICQQPSRINKMHFLFSVYYELTASTCFEHYLLIISRQCIYSSLYILCILCRLAATSWRNTHKIYQWPGRYLPAPEGGTDSVPKRWHIKFRRRWIAQKKEYNIQNMAKVWNQGRQHLTAASVLLCYLTHAAHYIMLWINGYLSLVVLPNPIWGTRWRSWLRHCVTNRKVVGSIPDRANGIFHWHNPSGRSLALGLTRPLTEMSTRNISWGG